MSDSSVISEGSVKFPSIAQAKLYHDDVTTEICFQSFADRYFVMISQLNKVGSLINAWSEEKPSGGKIFQTQILLGRRDDPLLNVYARQIIQVISEASDKPVLLAISLCQSGRETAIFQDVLNKIIEIKIE
jgi:proteasome assembly chaperone 3